MYPLEVVTIRWLYPLELVRFELKLLFGHSGDRAILSIDTVDSLQFLVVLIVRFLPHLERSPVWPSSCNRLMALYAFGGATPSCRGMSQLRIPCICSTIQCNKKSKQIMHVVLLCAQYSCDESVRLYTIKCT